ncbi:hypothetical protein ACIA49_38610 [Kribbella sp. NPDC051587]|uniref:hypothetical protein n=1 Tax=Kribbella sp. NPDC051587 TaxID=3364119 RepID=UPI0037ABACAF
MGGHNIEHGRDRELSRAAAAARAMPPPARGRGPEELAFWLIARNPHLAALLDDLPSTASPYAAPGQRPDSIDLDSLVLAFVQLDARQDKFLVEFGIGATDEHGYAQFLDDNPVGATAEAVSGLPHTDQAVLRMLAALTFPGVRFSVFYLRDCLTTTMNQQFLADWLAVVGSELTRPPGAAATIS